MRFVSVTDKQTCQQGQYIPKSYLWYTCTYFSKGNISRLLQEDMSKDVNFPGAWAIASICHSYTFTGELRGSRERLNI